MTVVIVGMLTALLISAVVVALVAVPARREGRELLSPQGEQLMQAALERTADAVGVAREKVGDLAEKLPVPSRDSGSGGQHSVQAQPVAQPVIDLRQQPDAAPQHRAS
jgi:hypothetical protein